MENTDMLLISHAKIQFNQRQLIVGLPKRFSTILGLKKGSIITFRVWKNKQGEITYSIKANPKLTSMLNEGLEN